MLRTIYGGRKGDKRRGARGHRTNSTSNTPPVKGYGCSSPRTDSGCSKFACKTTCLASENIYREEVLRVRALFFMVRENNLPLTEEAMGELLVRNGLSWEWWKEKGVNLVSAINSGNIRFNLS
jgi:hypothetical protein